ncbi:MAG: hypothetical protein BJ554DRAFT_5053 [Olpidium bornovanus]|uniref:Uncharacterized protein n=1 Tax=Olpidium bornovanus TaxID=278681 RepID=A0A8H8DLA0_9FUNG|nr:MAG: hypothetical protein BJ554DRAFT_5053 [Olpidium bornovanus]
MPSPTEEDQCGNDLPPGKTTPSHHRGCDLWASRNCFPGDAPRPQHSMSSLALNPAYREKDAAFPRDARSTVR